MPHPLLKKTTKQMIKEVESSLDPINTAAGEIRRCIPLRGKLHFWEKSTLVMGILNVTPDSFSDGQLYLSLNNAATHALDMISQGADIIDVGGMSTRPGAIEISEEEEINRVIPVIKAIREANASIIISVDTFRSKVADLALQSGADFINDITAGRGDQNMFQVMAESKGPVCLMHSRGTPQTMMSLTDYSGNNILDVIMKELKVNVHQALRKGVLRWNIFLDPGIGFAKTPEQCCEIINQLLKDKSRSCKFPVLLGVSKKSFIGKILKIDDPQQRRFGTAAAVTASVAAGASIIRVHDVKESVEISKMAEALWVTK